MPPPTPWPPCAVGHTLVPSIHSPWPAQSVAPAHVCSTGASTSTVSTSVAVMALSVGGPPRRRQRERLSARARAREARCAGSPGAGARGAGLPRQGALLVDELGELAVAVGELGGEPLEHGVDLAHAVAARRHGEADGRDVLRLERADRQAEVGQVLRGVGHRLVLAGRDDRGDEQHEQDAEQREERDHPQMLPRRGGGAATRQRCCHVTAGTGPG